MYKNLLLAQSVQFMALEEQVWQEESQGWHSFAVSLKNLLDEQLSEQVNASGSNLEELGHDEQDVADVSHVKQVESHSKQSLALWKKPKPQSLRQLLPLRNVPVGHLVQTTASPEQVAQLLLQFMQTLLRGYFPSGQVATQVVPSRLKVSGQEVQASCESAHALQFVEQERQEV